MICPRHGEQKSSDSRPLGKRTVALQLACPQCGRVNDPDALYCSGCRARIGIGALSVAAASGPARGFLVVEKGIRDLTPIPLEHRVYLLGTSAAAGIVLENPYVSREHAQISVEGGQFQVRDMGSRNGTFVNGSRLGGEARRLQSGDQIELAKGQVVLVFQEESAATVAPGPGRGLLVVKKGIRDLNPIPLDREVHLLGTSPTADIVLDNPYASREHAQISVEQGHYRIRDMGSRNGTFVNGSRLGVEARWLQSGDRIELARGQVVLEFREESPTTLMLDAVRSADEPGPVGARRPVAPDGTVTIMFSDIEGSTAMTERLGDRRAQEVLQDHNATVREQLVAYGGFEVKSQGDGFMVAFPSARRAVFCAVAVQRALAQYRERHPENQIRVRIGLHTGEAIKEADDFFGKNVILAARISAEAQGDEILVSSLLKQLTESAGDIEFDEGRDVELKGLSGTQRVHAVAWK